MPSSFTFDYPASSAIGSPPNSSIGEYPNSPSRSYYSPVRRSPSLESSCSSVAEGEVMGVVPQQIRGRPNRRSIVDGLLDEIYHRRCSNSRKRSSGGDDSDTLTDQSIPPDHGGPPRPARLGRQCLRVKEPEELSTLASQLQHHVRQVAGQLVRYLTRRDHLLAKRERSYDVITAVLQAVSPKRCVDTRMRFSLEPRGGDTGFMQWHDAMKMVARLPGGIPADFRKRLWLTMADKHLQTCAHWEQARRVCFNERSNPDDDELGTQIVKDLHRTGCSLFCGDDAEHNQSLLKRVLLAYARWNKVVGYCQGFNMLAAIILEVTEWCEEDALKVMIYLIEGVLPESYFANSLRGLSVDMAVFRDLLRLRLPKLSRHLDLLQSEAGDSASGASYEPPLTNVFTMQWFLTLFSNCLPKATVLRVWDLIFLEGNEVLLRTALAIWDGLADRILTVESADEFYSIMRVLTREMLEFGLMDANHLVKTICTMASFPFPQLGELRDKYTYNITPFSAALGLARRAGFRLFHSDDEEEEEEQQQLAVAAWCFSSVLPNQMAAIKARGEARGSASLSSSGSSSAPNFTSLGPGAFGPSAAVFPSPPPHGLDSDRMSLDISALKKQYAKLRERQKQAHIILTAARLPTPAPHRPAPIAVNHLLVGKKPLITKRGQMQKGTIHLVMQNKPAKKDTSPSSIPSPTSAPFNSESGLTLSWNRAKIERRASEQICRTSSADLLKLKPKDDANDDSSSTSTELCDDDDPGTLSDFDSDLDEAGAGASPRRGPASPAHRSARSSPAKKKGHPRKISISSSSSHEDVSAVIPPPSAETNTPKVTTNIEELKIPEIADSEQPINHQTNSTTSCMTPDVSEKQVGLNPDTLEPLSWEAQTSSDLHSIWSEPLQIDTGKADDEITEKDNSTLQTSSPVQDALSNEEHDDDFEWSNKTFEETLQEIKAQLQRKAALIESKASSAGGIPSFSQSTECHNRRVSCTAIPDTAWMSLASSEALVPSKSISDLQGQLSDETKDDDTKSVSPTRNSSSTESPKENCSSTESPKKSSPLADISREDSIEENSSHEISCTDDTRKDSPSVLPTKSECSTSDEDCTKPAMTLYSKTKNDGEFKLSGSSPGPSKCFESMNETAPQDNTSSSSSTSEHVPINSPTEHLSKLDSPTCEASSLDMCQTQSVTASSPLRRETKNNGCAIRPGQSPPPPSDQGTVPIEGEKTRSLVGNVSLRNPTAPITFNPFPTSRKSPSKAPTEVGVKLGLYDPGSFKTDNGSPTKSSPTKRKFFW